MFITIILVGSSFWVSFFFYKNIKFPHLEDFDLKTDFLNTENRNGLNLNGIGTRDEDLVGIQNSVQNSFHSELSRLDIFPSPFIDDNHVAINYLPKAKTKWKGPFPCYRGGNSDASKHGTGLIFVKIHKCASTTNSNVAVRIARQYGKCKLHYKHQPAFNISGLDGRDQEASFLWTFVREPTKRYVSHFYYFDVSRHEKPPTDENLKKFLDKKFMGMGGYQLPYATVSNVDSELNPNVVKVWNPEIPTQVQNAPILIDRVRNVMEQYNFIGIAERVNESLVVLSFLLDLSLNDIVYINKRVSGGYDKFYNEDKSAFCVKTIKGSLSKSKQDYFQSAEWKARIVGDNLLYQSALKSLDLTIEQIGREQFNERLETFEKLLEEVQSACNRPECDYCTSAGKLQKRAFNCGHRCIIGHQKGN